MTEPTDRPADDEPTEQDVRDVVDRMFLAIEAHDIEGLGELFADDIAVWHSVTDRTVDKPGVLAILGWLAKPGVELRYEPQELLVARVAGGGVRVSRRHVLHVAIEGHAPMALPVSIYLTVARRGDAFVVVAVDEYTDAKQTDELIAAVPR